MTAHATPQHTGPALSSTDVTGQGRILVTYRTIGSRFAAGAAGATLIFTDPDAQ